MANRSIPKVQIDVERFGKILKNKKLNYQAVAKLVGVAPKTLYRVKETGQMPIYLLVDVCSAIDIRQHEILTSDDKCDGCYPYFRIHKMEELLRVKGDQVHRLTRELFELRKALHERGEDQVWRDIHEKLEKEYKEEK